MDNIQTIYKNRTDPQSAATNSGSQTTNCSKPAPNSQYLILTTFLILAPTSNLGPTGESPICSLNQSEGFKSPRCFFSISTSAYTLDQNKWISTC